MVALDRVEALTGYRPTAFAYPYGHSDKEFRRLVAAAKFAVGCLTGIGVCPGEAGVRRCRAYVSAIGQPPS